jgi:hypothetical protein
MKQTPETLQRELKKLRKIVETSKDPLETRIAYTIEHAIRWATQETVGWPRPHKEVSDVAKMVEKRL